MTSQESVASKRDPSTAGSPDSQMARIEEKAGERFAQNDKRRLSVVREKQQQVVRLGRAPFSASSLTMMPKIGDW
jgi:hypothetical protein